jgi:predicted nucleic acid binding AN1-type Zn finger protein
MRDVREKKTRDSIFELQHQNKRRRKIKKTRANKMRLYLAENSINNRLKSKFEMKHTKKIIKNAEAISND